MEIGFTFAHKKATPLIQVAVALGIGWLGMMVAHFAYPGEGSEYFAALVALIFFCILNTVISIAYKSYLRYTIPSYYLYVMLVVVLFLSAKYLSGISIWDLWNYRMMLISVSIFYFVISNLVRAVRLIYELSESEM